MPRWYRGTPPWIAGAVVGVAAVVAAWAGVVSYGASRYADGRRSVTDGARVDSAVLSMIQRRDSIARAHTDTVVQRVTVTRWRVDTVVRSVPDTVRAQTGIAELVSITYTLSAQVDTLTAAINSERAASRLRAQVDSAALVGALRVVAVERETVKQLEKRPTRAKAALMTVGGAVVGLVVGVMR